MSKRDRLLIRYAVLAVIGGLVFTSCFLCYLSCVAQHVPHPILWSTLLGVAYLTLLLLEFWFHNHEDLIFRIRVARLLTILLSLTPELLHIVTTTASPSVQEASIINLSLFLALMVWGFIEGLLYILTGVIVVVGTSQSSNRFRNSRTK